MRFLTYSPGAGVYVVADTDAPPLRCARYDSRISLSLRETTSADPEALVWWPPLARLITQAEAALLPGFVVVQPTTRTRNPAQIAWTTVQGVINSDADLTSGKYGIKIRGDGVAVLPGGSWRSDVPGVPCFVVKAGVTRRIIMQDCNFFGYGMNGYHTSGMVLLENGNNVEFRECMRFSGKPPAGYAGAFPGKDYCADNARSVFEINCESYGTSGGFCAEWQDGGITMTERFRFENTRKRNIDGRMVDAAGNWRTGEAPYVDRFPACFVAITGAREIKGVVGTNNWYDNDPEYGAHGEDAISVVGSSVAPGWPGSFMHHLVENWLSYDPAFTGVQPIHGLKPNLAKIGNSGTMGNAADGANASGTPRNATTVSHGWKFDDHLVITGSNGGLSMATGNNIEIANSVMLSAAAFRSRAPAGYTIVGVNEALGTTTVGLIIWDQYTGGDPAVYFDIRDTNNTVGWHYALNDGTIRTNHFFAPSAHTSTGRVILPTIADIPAGLARNDTYRAAFLNRWRDAGTIIGCTTPAP